jgi:hypothetical protein
VVFLQALIPNSRYGKIFPSAAKGAVILTHCKKLDWKKIQIVEPMEEF